MSREEPQGPLEGLNGPSISPLSIDGFFSEPRRVLASEASSDPVSQSHVPYQPSLGQGVNTPNRRLSLATIPSQFPAVALSSTPSGIPRRTGESVARREDYNSTVIQDMANLSLLDQQRLIQQPIVTKLDIKDQIKVHTIMLERLKVEQESRIQGFKEHISIAKINQQAVPDPTDDEKSLVEGNGVQKSDKRFECTFKDCKKTFTRDSDRRRHEETTAKHRNLPPSVGVSQGPGPMRTPRQRHMSSENGYRGGEPFARTENAIAHIVGGHRVGRRDSGGSGRGGDIAIPLSTGWGFLTQQGIPYGYAASVTAFTDTIQDIASLELSKGEGLHDSFATLGPLAPNHLPPIPPMLPQTTSQTPTGLDILEENHTGLMSVGYAALINAGDTQQIDSPYPFEPPTIE
ncbi:hypothetical protein TWF730_001835 [Orbilia blumenaviensis]|uniref:C2H2-type domain-containing protein n=1 Tax=Orbilia blumenaviensis TaxID=1796055 RepID=A0AAV9UEG8_9PEZI